MKGGETMKTRFTLVTEQEKLNKIKILGIEKKKTASEIINTAIDEYLKNRLETGKNIEFNELIQYLNAFITCK